MGCRFLYIYFKFELTRNKKAWIFLVKKEGDDSQFLQNCEKIVKNRILYYNPMELFIIGVNTIFDSRWVKFAKSASEEFAFWSTDERFTITNLHPNMYNISFNIFERTYRGYEERTEIGYIKKRKKEEHDTFYSAHGEKQYKYKTIEDGLKVYYTSDTSNRDLGTLIIYYKDYIRFNRIFIVFDKNKNWDVCETYGISSEEVKLLINKNFHYKKQILRVSDSTS